MFFETLQTYARIRDAPFQTLEAGTRGFFFSSHLEIDFVSTFVASEVGANFFHPQIRLKSWVICDFLLKSPHP